MAVTSALVRRTVGPRAKDTRRLKDESYIDVEAREVKDKPRLSDSTIRADKRDVGSDKKSKRLIAAGAALGAGSAYVFSRDSDKDKKDTSSTGRTSSSASSSTERGSSSTERTPSSTERTSSSTDRSSSSTSRTADKAGSSSRAGGGRSATGKAFDAKFAEMRRAGKSTFTFNGKTYTTRHAGESSEQHKAKMQKIRDKTEEEMQRLTTMAKGGMAKKMAIKKPMVKKITAKKK